MTSSDMTFQKFLWKAYFHYFLKMFPAAWLRTRYRLRMGRAPDMEDPKTFTEKILVKMIHDRDPRLTMYADKYRVRDYVKSALGTDKYLSKLYAVFHDPKEIARAALPKRFVMKPNHMSGQFKIVQDSGTADAGELAAAAAKWMRINYGKKMLEWAYRDIKPCIIFEELLEPSGTEPYEYKFFCFNGEPKMIQVVKDRLSSYVWNYYDMDFSLLPVKNPHKSFPEEMKRPENLEETIEIARKLSAGADFLRVDLYNFGDRVVFGELTNYPACGLITFQPPEWDLILGGYWDQRGYP